MTDTTHCAICAADPSDGTDFVLDEPIHWRGPFQADAPPALPGEYRLCAGCTAWRPDARTAPPPVSFRALLDASATNLNSATASALRVSLLGAGRHLAAQLRPIHLEQT